MRMPAGWYIKAQILPNLKPLSSPNALSILVRPLHPVRRATCSELDLHAVRPLHIGRCGSKNVENVTGIVRGTGKPVLVRALIGEESIVID